MNASSQEIAEAFELTGGPQVILTKIPASELPPGKKGDELTLVSLEGKEEAAKIGSIEYALKPGGEEFYGINLEPPRIGAFDSFKGGTFQNLSQSNAED